MTNGERVGVAHDKQLRRQLVVRLLAVFILAFCVWMLVHGYATGAIEVGTRRSSFFLTGPDMWLGYVFWFLGASLTPFLYFIQHAQTKTYRVLSKVVGISWFVTLALCFLRGAHVL